MCVCVCVLGGGVLKVLVVKLLTGFEAFDPPVKVFALAISVVILDGASVVKIRKDVVASTVQSMFQNVT